eukprot:205445_1
MNQGDSKQAEKACAKIDRSKPNCWIGLRRPFQKWDDHTKVKEFVNWSPGEPNNFGQSEDCVEMYSGGDGKWNDVACEAKRYFLCNIERPVQRMKTEKRDQMIIKRIQRHKIKWDLYQDMAKRKKMMKAWYKKMREKKKRIMKQKREEVKRMREVMRKKMFQSQFSRMR